MSLIARLIEAGVPADLIEEVAMLVVEKRALDERRATDRDRQQRHRDNVTSRDVTPCHSDPSLSRPPNEKISNPPTHTHPEPSPRARKGHRLPSNWEPEPLTGEVAANVATWPAGAIERELARFRDWAASATGPNAIKSDWQAAWRNWLRTAHDEGRHLKHDRQRPQNQRETTRETGERVAASYAAAGGGAAHLVPRLGPPGRDA